MTAVDKLAYSINEAAEATGICRVSLYKEIGLGHLKTRKVGRRTLITADAMRAWLGGDDAPIPGARRARSR